MKNEPILWSKSVINRMFVRTDSKALDANSITNYSENSLTENKSAQKFLSTYRDFSS